jgi:hypothetical protein
MSVDRANPSVAAQFKDPTFQAYAPITHALHRRPDPVRAGQVLQRPHPPGSLEQVPRRWINGVVPGNADQCMYLVGVLEIVAGVFVAVAPRIGAWVVAVWLAGIIVNLLTPPGYYDVALRDFGLLVSAVALARLAQAAHAAAPAGR